MVLLWFKISLPSLYRTNTTPIWQRILSSNEMRVLHTRGVEEQAIEGSSRTPDNSEINRMIAYFTSKELYRSEQSRAEQTDHGYEVDGGEDTTHFPDSQLTDRETRSECGGPLSPACMLSILTWLAGWPIDYQVSSLSPSPPRKP